MVNNDIAHVFKEATIMTTGGSENEVSKHVGPVFTFTRVLTSKGAHFSSSCNKSNEHGFNDTTSKEILIDNQTIQYNKEKIFDQLALAHVSGFPNRFLKVEKK